MKILDALGMVLEEKVSVVKIDIVLGIRFIEEIYEIPKDELIAKYKEQHNVTLYSHDFVRAEHIRRLHQMHVFDHENNMAAPITYFADTLTVMYEWIGRHRTVFMGSHRSEAYQLFMLLCQSYRCHSVLNMDDNDCDFLFNYIYLRDFIDQSLMI